MSASALAFVLFWAPSHTDMDVENRAQWVALTPTTAVCEQRLEEHTASNDQGFYWCEPIDLSVDGK